MIEFRQFRIEDAEILCPTAIDPAVHGSDYEKVSRWHIESGPHFTGTYQGEIVCAFFMHIRPGVGGLWAVFSPNIRNCIRPFLECAREILEVVIEQHKLSRVRAFAHVGFGTLLKHLGFKRTMRMWKDQYLWVRT